MLTSHRCGCPRAFAALAGAAAFALSRSYALCMGDARAFVVEADVAPNAHGDLAAVGAAVTVALCGHWKHDGPCRWPHNNAICPGPELVTFRTLFVAEPQEEEIVRTRVEAALRASRGWRVEAVRARSINSHEQALAERLLAGPRLTDPR